MGRKWIALFGVVVVGVILIIQMTQGENNLLHWIGLAAIAIAFIATVVDVRKASQTPD